MRRLALAIALAGLMTAPAFAKSKTAPKTPKAGQFCAKGAVGTTAQDASGGTLECKAGKKGKPHWTKK